MFVFFLAVGLLIGHSPSAIKPNDKPVPTQNTESRNRDQGGSELPPIVIQVVGAETPQQKAAEDKKRDDADAKDKRHTFWFTLVIAAAAVLQASAGVGQILIYRRQTALMAGGLAATKLAAEAAITSANTAKASLEHGAETAVRQLRAYLTVSQCVIRFHSDYEIEVVVGLKNCGQTPAYDVTSWRLCTVREYPLAQPLTVPDLSQLPKGVAIIPPGHRHEVHVKKHSYPKPIWDSLSTGKAALFLYGEAKSSDVFEKEIRTLHFQLIFGGPAGLRVETQQDGKKVGFLSMDKEGNFGD